MSLVLVRRGAWAPLGWPPAPAPGHATRTCVQRGANDNGCGPLGQPIWHGTRQSGWEHAGRPHTGSWDAGVLQGLAGCPCSPRARGSQRKQGASLQVSSKLTRATDLITQKDTQPAAHSGPQEAPLGRAVLCLKEGVPLAASLEVSTLCPLFPVLRAPPQLLGTPIDLGGTWLAVKFQDSNSTSIPPSFCLFCMVLELCGSLLPHHNRKDCGDVRMLKLL